jgi:para-nitrobenzyl esterase
MRLTALLVLVGLAGPFQSPSSVRNAGPLTVDTTEGTVIGQAAAGSRTWQGIPYAAPPIGDLRWRPAGPAPHRDAPLDALAFGPVCPQDPSTQAFPPPDAPAMVGEEDCLTLNIWAPADAGSYPVLFFVHGGGFIQGSGSDPLYDGARLASHGAVVVTFDYRLGALGFLAHPAFATEDPRYPWAGNYGFGDQLSALHWVAANIAGFDGDPQRITVFGESAGGVSVCALMTSPAAVGLFAGAIMQSGNCLTDSMRATRVDRGRVKSGFDQGRRFAQAAGCTDEAGAPDCLRALSVEEVLTTLPGEIGSLSPGAETYGPEIDGHLVLEPPGEAMAAGRSQPVPFIAGANADEGTLFVRGWRTLSVAGFEALVRVLYPQWAARILAAYPAEDYAAPTDALADLYGDAAFVCPARRAVAEHGAAGRRAYLYHFTRVPNVSQLAGLGAFHGVELFYLFDHYPEGSPGSFGEVDRKITAAMQEAWVGFAETRRPDPGDLDWPVYSPETGMALELGESVSVVAGWRADRCDLWDAVAGYAPAATRAAATYLPALLDQERLQP